MYKSLIHMNKISTFLISSFLLFLLCWISLNLESSFSWSYTTLTTESFVHSNFGLKMGGISFFFILMVLPVTSFVLLYSSFYMEHYNNYKFTMLLICFFASMLLLSSSSSLLNLMLGWDGLGITSICLIMFYPNKNTSYNSILTMFFNRLGDVALILILSLMFFNYSLFFEIFDLSLIMALLMIACSFTKSAQFPLSSWLPAAMSAPTPISAMVHSSTLVTAGLFFLVSIFSSLSFSALFIPVLFFSLVTFLVGGFSANLEKDFKKMVAFSTMSQISMILCFFCFGYIFIGLYHMVFHAFFKTLLFCCSGALFMLVFSNQFKKSVSNSILANLLFFFFVVSLYAMSGLTFSSSFFSKDQCLEALLSLDLLVNPLMLLLGSALTIFYSCSLLSSLLSRSLFHKSESNKKFPFIGFSFFSLLVLFFSQILCAPLLESSPLLDSFLVFFILLFLLYCCLLNITSLSISSFYLSFYIWGMKLFSYSVLGGLVFKGEQKEFFFSSDLFMNKDNFSLSNYLFQPKEFYSMGLLYCFFSSIFLTFYLFN